MAAEDAAGHAGARRTEITSPVSTVGAPFLTVAEVAERMRVSRMTVYRLVHSGELPAVRFGRSFRVAPAAVEQLIEAARFEAG